MAREHGNGIHALAQWRRVVALSAAAHDVNALQAIDLWHNPAYAGSLHEAVHGVLRAGSQASA
jgi:hypothetical protein